MGKVLMEITMSLDGYTTGPEVSAEAPLGRGGERLHEWMFAGKSAADSDRWLTDRFSTIGAVIIGRRMADLGIGPWGEEPVFHAPCFIVTHRPAETIVKKGGTSYIFVTEGIEAAMVQAQAAAGAQDVMVEGGADIDRQYLNAGLIDEIRLHVAPIVLGGGTPLFAGVCPDLRLVPSQATNSPLATHLTYRVDASAVRAQPVRSSRSDGIESAMAQAKAAAGDRDVLVHGAYTAQRALEADVLDELLISHVPVLFGAGRRLFGVLPKRVELEIVRVIDTPEATHIRYRIRR